MERIQKCLFQNYRKLRTLPDLVPVCPNCHAMLHTRNPPMDFEELRDLVRSSASSATQSNPKNQPGEHTEPSVLGKYAYLPGTSEEFLREKQAEIEREEAATERRSNFDSRIDVARCLTSS
jgi:hypothetical protein